MMFRELSPAEAAEFKEWARDNFTAGDTIAASIWHPVVVAECEAINEVWRAENCECGIAKNGKWGKKLFDEFGCTC